MRAILSHPYSNALFWWFDNLQGGMGTERQNSGHPYYEMIYHDAEKFVDVALTAAIVFEDLVLPGVDAAFPGMAGPEGSLINEELGLRADWDRFSRARAVIGRHESDFRVDPEIGPMLRDPVQQLNLEYAIADVFLSIEEEARVVCSSGRQELISRLLMVDSFRSELGGLGYLEPASESPVDLALDLSEYVSVAGIRFALASWEGLRDLKWDPRIRTYASGFLREADSLDAGSGILLDRLSDAADAAEAHEQLAGFFAASSRTLNVAGFIPVIGTVASAASLGSDIAAAHAAKQAMDMKWHELGPEIQRVQSLHALEDAIARQRERRRGC